MHKPEHTRLFTTNTSAKIGTIHAVSSNVVTAEKVNAGGGLFERVSVARPGCRKEL